MNLPGGAAGPDGELHVVCAACGLMLHRRVAPAALSDCPRCGGAFRPGQRAVELAVRERLYGHVALKSTRLERRSDGTSYQAP